MLNFSLFNNFTARKLILGLIICNFSFCISATLTAQTRSTYAAPQDTVKKKLPSNVPLTTTQTSTKPFVADTRMVAAAARAADILKDSTKYNTKNGVLVEDLFQKADLDYFAKQGIDNTVALFELINKSLPKGFFIVFKTGANETVTTGTNPLVLKNLRAVISQNPANINNASQWKENVYQAYMARDYATQLYNTVTKTSATREIRETPGLTLIDYNGKPITLRQILAKEQAKTKDKYQAEKEAVAAFRDRSFPNARISKENANENYKRALFQLIDLQEGDLTKHPLTKAFLAEFAADIRKGTQSNAISSLKNNNFYDANVPGNRGPVLLTEDSVIDAAKMQQNADIKALEITMLTALHYGERDAVKLLRRLVNNQGSLLAAQTGDYTVKRLGELSDHGTEKLKSLGFTKEKSAYMTASDLVLMAVASPETPVVVTPEAYINLTRMANRLGVGVGAPMDTSAIKKYVVVTQTQDTRSTLLFNPRISLGSHHSEYRASYDAVDWVPELIDGNVINQKGSRIIQNGAEGRIESDLYFAKPQRIMNRGVKPGVYPEFGVIAGIGNRSVGDDNSTTLGRQGPVPKFSNFYINWGGHIGLNMGPFLLGVDANLINTTTSEDDPRERFFDLSQGMTFYRYSLLLHVFNLGMGKIKEGKGSYLLLDGEVAGETNNSGYRNASISKGGTNQIADSEWARDYTRAHPGGVYNAAIATAMIQNGDVKANYAADNYAALHLSLQKSNFTLRGTAGLYNLYTVTTGNLINSDLFKNTINGNFFGEIKLSLSIAGKIYHKKHIKTESYQVVNGVESAHQVTESDEVDQKPTYGPRNHAVFLNKYTKMKKDTVTVKTVVKQ